MTNWLRRMKLKADAKYFDRVVAGWRANSERTVGRSTRVLSDDPTGIREAREQMSTIEGRREQAGYDRKR